MRNEDSTETGQRLQARALELTRANETLQAELAEQRRANEVLGEQLQGLRSLAANSADIYWTQDADYRFMVFGDGLDGGKLGAGWDGAVGKCYWDLPGLISLSLSWEAHRARLDARQPFRNFEYMRLAGDQPPDYFSVSGVPVFDGKNRFLGYRGTTRDISEAKHSEEAERQATRFLKHIVDHIPIAFHMKSVQNGHRVISWNQAAQALYGLTSEQAMGRTMHDLWPKEDADRMHAADLEMVASGVMQDFLDRSAPTKNRGAIRVHLRKFPLKDASGLVSHILVTTEDITERRQVETALRASEARFRAVVAAMAEGVLIRDADGRIIDSNASAERILGKTLNQMKGHVTMSPEWQTMREDGSPMTLLERPSAVAMRTGLPQSNVVVGYRKPDGRDLWVQLNVQPLFDRTCSTPIGFVTTVTDISQRKYAEIEIVRLNVQLENRVLRRTTQLAMVNQELEAFSYSVAHDLRSPLSSINGYAAFLQKALPTESGERAKHYLSRIRGAAERMGELIDGLLSLAQLSRTSLSWETVDLSEEALQSIRQCAENDPTRRVQTTVEPGLLVQADVALLRQVLENLIGNAWKFSSKKKHAEISIGRDPAAGQPPVYFVRDNGAGFDMAYADKLFGTFQRLHSAEEFAGSGIGLATVQRIITRHGGRIWAQSSPNQGSTFYFTLGGDQGQTSLSASRDGKDSGLGALSGSQSDEGSGLASLAGQASSRPQFGNAVVTWPDAATAMSNGGDPSTVSERQFSSAFEHAAIGMTLIGIDLRRLRVNQAYCQMLGYSEAEMLARTTYDVTHPDDVEWDALQRNRVLAGEIETYQTDKRYLHQSGRILWGHLSCSLVRDADRKPLHFILQIQEITERKVAEQILRENEGRFRALAALSSDWFWEQDEHFRFILIAGDETCSAAVTRGIAIGKTRWEMDYVNMSKSVWADHQALLKRHEIFRDFEVTRLDSEGQQRHLSISGLPIFDLSGRFTGYRGTGRDNTEMRRVSKALRTSEWQLRQVTDNGAGLDYSI